MIMRYLPLLMLRGRGCWLRGKLDGERQARDKTNDECVHRLLLEGKIRGQF